MMQFTFHATYNGFPLGANYRKAVDVLCARSGDEAEKRLTEHYGRTYNLHPAKTEEEAEKGRGLEFILDLDDVSTAPTSRRRCRVCKMRMAENVFYFLNLSGQTFSSHPVFLCNRPRVYIPNVTHADAIYDSHIGYECLYQLKTYIEFTRGIMSLSPTIQYKIDKWEQMFKTHGTERRLYIRRD